MAKWFALDPDVRELAHLRQHLTEAVDGWRSRKPDFLDAVSQYRMTGQLLVIFAISTGIGIVSMSLMEHLIRLLFEKVGAGAMSSLHVYSLVGLYLTVWLGTCMAAFYTCILVFSRRFTELVYKLQKTL